MQVLHSTIIGKGSPLIILHGYFGMGDNWRVLANKFSNNFEVHIVDQRNHGRSFHSDDFDYELLVEDLLYYIEHFNLTKVNMLGHSMGGKVAMLFAVTYPVFVDKLIVADIGPKFYQPHHEHILAALNAVNFSIHNSRKKVEDVLKITLKNQGLFSLSLKMCIGRQKSVLIFDLICRV